MLRCEELSIRVGDFALQADLSFAPQEITALMGPSGAGKSTLLSVIGGFLSPAAGRVIWQDQDLTALPPGERPISVLFQDNNLFPHLTAAENVGLGLRPSLRLAETEKEAVAVALDEVGLAGMHDRKPAELSGGQQSRVALARVLVAERPVVLLDEPFSALGPVMKDEMLDLVQDRLGAAGKTVIMVTHDPADAQRIANCIAVVADGQVASPAPTGPLLQDPPSALSAYLRK